MVPLVKILNIFCSDRKCRSHFTLLINTFIMLKLRIYEDLRD